MTINLPVSIGDHVYFIRDHENQKRIAFGTIKEIFFSQDMRLMIRVKGYRAAEWGVKAFRTRKEAETAIGNNVVAVFRIADAGADGFAKLLLKLGQFLDCDDGLSVCPVGFNGFAVCVFGCHLVPP